jgi:hypothetical protein
MTIAFEITSKWQACQTFVETGVPRKAHLPRWCCGLDGFNALYCTNSLPPFNLPKPACTVDGLAHLFLKAACFLGPAPPKGNSPKDPALPICCEAASDCKSEKLIVGVRRYQPHRDRACFPRPTEPAWRRRALPSIQLHASQTSTSLFLHGRNWPFC